MSVAGRVMPLPKGSWDADTEYTVLDIVGHKGSSFIAKRTSIGVEPVDGAYWQKLVGIQLDTELSETSENGVQNKVVAEAISQLNDDLTETMSNVSAHDTAIADLTVEQSTQASNISNLDIEVAKKANSSSLAKVATSGSYNDLSNKPTIPTVNNGSLTIQKNGSNVATFTANQSSNATANITTPDGMISDAYNSEKTYVAGEYCIDNNKMWKCKVPCKGIKPSEGTYWTARKISDEIKQLNTDLSDKASKSKFAIITGTFPNNGNSIGNDYPSGFNASNTVILAVNIVYDSENIQVHQSWWNAYLGAKVYVNAENNMAYGKTFRIAIMRTDI